MTLPNPAENLPEPPVTSGPPPPSPEKQVWGFWATFGLGLATGAIFLLAQTLVTVAFIIDRVVHDTSLDISQLTDQLLSNGDLLSAAIITSAILCTGFVLLMVKARRGEPIARYLALKSISLKTALVMLAVTIAFIAASYGINSLIPQPETDFMGDAYVNASLPVVFWLAMVIFAPIFEEVFIRGFLFIGFRQSRLGPAGAIILTAVIWALLHVQYNYYEMTLIFFLGIVLGIARYKTDSLWAPFIVHGLNNLLAMVMITLF
jgi:membrane protease YdiL (CAAX protease family)